MRYRHRCGEKLGGKLSRRFIERSKRSERPERAWKMNCWRVGIPERIEREIAEIRDVVYSIHETLKTLKAEES